MADTPTSNTIQLLIVALFSQITIFYLVFEVTARVDKITQIAFVKAQAFPTSLFHTNAHKLRLLLLTQASHLSMLQADTHTCAHSFVTFLAQLNSQKPQKWD